MFDSSDVLWIEKPVNTRSEQILANQKRMNELAQEYFAKKSFKFHKIQLSFARIYQPKKVDIYAVSKSTYQVMNSAELLQHYFFNILAVTAQVRFSLQAKALATFKFFTQKLLGKVSIQSFVDRSTRQSYKLLPEF